MIAGEVNALLALPGLARADSVWSANTSGNNRRYKRNTLDPYGVNSMGGQRLKRRNNQSITR